MIDLSFNRMIYVRYFLSLEQECENCAKNMNKKCYNQSKILTVITDCPQTIKIQFEYTTYCDISKTEYTYE